MNVQELEKCFPNDHSRQVDATYYIDWIAERMTENAPVVVDLGAGSGSSAGQILSRIPRCSWIGVDIDSSPEVKARKLKDLDFRSYNGTDIPLEDNSVDAIYSRQVFEHVRYPEALLKDIHRVLKPGGYFVGSVSQLEPYHSYSFWNFTYYGFATLASDAGLKLVEFRPGVDGISLIARNFVKFQMRSDVSIFKKWLKSESPLNSFTNSIFESRSHAERNKSKTAYSGHLCFAFQK